MEMQLMKLLESRKASRAISEQNGVAHVERFPLRFNRLPVNSKAGCSL